MIPTTTRLIRRAEMLRISGLSISSVYRLERKGEFPARRRLGPNSVAWDLASVLQWAQSRELVVASESGAFGRNESESDRP